MGRKSAVMVAVKDINNIITTSGQVWQYSKAIRGWTEAKKTYSVSLTSKEPVYIDVRHWLTKLIDEAGLRSTTVVASNKGPLMEIHDSDHVDKFTFGGHKYTVKIDKPTSIKDFLKDDTGDHVVLEETLQFTANNRAAKLALLEHFEHLRLEALKRHFVPRLKTSSSYYGDWGQSLILPKRTLDSVVLKEGQIERVVADIDLFLKSEAEYNRLGMPYHRGYLLEGPPGTGKSSLPKALAAHFNVNLYYLQLGSVSSDTQLAQRVSGVPSKNILLLEDVDVFSSMKNRDDSQQNTFTMSGLLNVLDGVTTPHGLITFLTTNDRDSIDEAILRPGRVDLIEHLGLLSKGQAERMFSVFYGRPPMVDLGLEGKAPAYFMNLIKQNMHDPERIEQMADDHVLATIGGEYEVPRATYEPDLHDD